MSHVVCRLCVTTEVEDVMSVRRVPGRDHPFSRCSTWRFKPPALS